MLETCIHANPHMKADILLMTVSLSPCSTCFRVKQTLYNRRVPDSVHGGLVWYVLCDLSQDWYDFQFKLGQTLFGFLVSGE